MLSFRRARVVVPILLASAAVVAGCGSSSSSTAKNASAASSAGSSSSSSSSSGSSGCATVRVGTISFTPGVTTGIQGWGAEKNLWNAALKSAGVCKVDWETFAGGPLLNAALIGGSIDMGVYGDTPAVVAKSRGTPDRLVNQDLIGLDTWVAVKPNGPSSLAGLKGGSVAVLPGGYIYRAILEMLQEEGLEGKVKVVTIQQNPQGIAAVKSGAVTAYASQPSGALVNSGLKVIAKASSPQFTNVLGTTVTVITSRFLAAHPNLPAAWNKASAAVLANAEANQAAYYAFDGKALGDSVSLVREVSPLSQNISQPFSAKGLTLLNTLNTFLVQQKLSKGLVNIKAWEVPNP